MIRRGLNHDCALGTVFFQHYGCRIHYDAGTLEVEDIEISIRYCKITPSVCGIFLCSDEEVEPGTEQVIEARFMEGYEQNFDSPGILVLTFEDFTSAQKEMLYLFLGMTTSWKLLVVLGGLPVST